MNFAPTLCRRSSRPHSQKRGAFSLLEVAIALVIFVIGAIALLRIFPTGLNVLEHSGNRRTAAQMSQNVLTSYDKGDLAATKPDAIYEADNSFGWQDYPLSMVGLRRDKGTMPETQDDFGSSAAGHLRFIRGEKQRVSGGAFITNYVVDRRQVNVYREGIVSGVKVDVNTGQLDFKGAKYVTANISTVPNPSTVDFREPYIADAPVIVQMTPTPAPTPAAPTPTPTPVPLTLPSASNGVITINRTFYPANYDLSFKLLQANSSGSASMASFTVSGLSATDSSAPTITATQEDLQLSIGADTGQGTQYGTITLDDSSDNVSIERKQYELIIVSSGAASTTPTAPSNTLPIRAPQMMRDGTNGVTFYPSLLWTNGGCYRQPMAPLPSSDASYPQDSSASNLAVQVPASTTVQADLQEPLFFRQFLGQHSGQGDRIKIQLPVSASYPDPNGSFDSIQLTEASLDYNVFDWTYLTEFADQFGTPFPADTAGIPPYPAPTPQSTPTPDEAIWRQFASDAPDSFTRGALRELRTSVGNLRGPIYIKGIYSPSTPDVGTYTTDTQFDPRDTSSPEYASLNNDDKKAFRKHMADAAKQGRFYLPDTTQSAGGTLQSARLYYRSRDGWAQQIGVAASHYLPFSSNYVGKPEREPWREYFHANDGYLYFRAAEAGKTVSYTPMGGTPQQLEIKPDVQFVSTLPSNVPADFINAPFNNPDNPSDVRNGKFFYAVSRDTVPGNIVDVGRDGSGVFVRTLWLDSGRYAQEGAP